MSEEQEGNLMEEKITLHDFHSSEDLKEEVEKRISIRRNANWDIVKFVTRGPYLLLTFKARGA